jgi:hypothetical protein
LPPVIDALDAADGVAERALGVVLAHAHARQ